MLEIRELRFRYGRHTEDVLRGVNLTLQPGEIGILLGKNGAGKSTLFKSVLGIEKPSGGSILFRSVPLEKIPLRERARHIAYVPQEVIFGSLTVFDTVLSGRLAYFGRTAGPEDRRAVERVLTELGLSSFSERPADRLSGGEKQKVAIARALAGEPELILFDEPSAGLDLANGQLLYGEIRRLAREHHIAVLCSLHDLTEAAALGDRFFFLKDGSVRYAGGKELFTQEVIEEIFDAKVTVWSVDGKILISGGNLS